MDAHPVCGWYSLLPRLVEANPASVVDALRSFVPDAGPEQLAAWRESLRVLQREGARVLTLEPSASAHGAVLEYELPREGGRRPDVVVLGSGRVVVLEFKSAQRPRRADLDQVAAYARDLRNYHSACSELDVVPALVLPGSATQLTVDGVTVLGAARLADWLLSLGGAGPVVDLQQFLDGEYAPLPTLVAAARLLFERQPLPFIRRAASAGVRDSVERVLELARRARANGERHLCLLTGVPGAGKTLVGLQVAHSAQLGAGEGPGGRGAPATFLSGNGPLVQVLQDALGDKTFVRDMHAFIKRHALQRPEQVPPERVIIFDEAQRAWDAAKVADFYGTKLDPRKVDLTRSEPRMLAEIAERMRGGCLVLALVGTGQEIHSGEEGGMRQWAEAVRGRGWHVSGPPALRELFTREAGGSFNEERRLDLDVTLRAHAAGHLHQWVASVMQGEATEAAPLAGALRSAGFPIYVTRDLGAAKAYARSRFAGERLRRYGLLASSKADRFLLKWGIDCGFQATKQLKIGPWFNADPDHPLSCCQFGATATEFQSQGLELDLPIVCWGDDLRRESARWKLRPGGRPSPLIRDPFQLRVNAYRVLLTRGREGLVLFVPDERVLDETFSFLVAAGALDARGERTHAVA